MGGYYRGLLTRKVLATMEAFLTQFVSCDFYMKVDDDTFVAWSRLWGRVRQVYEENVTVVYMGAFIASTYKNHPIRDQKSKWYEPLSAYPNESYPTSALGGVGYILGRALVDRIVTDKIAENNILWNEDRAVGVWAARVNASGLRVAYKHIGETAEYRNKHARKKGPWKFHGLAMQHPVGAESIACLARLDGKGDMNAQIDPCFPPK